jgi:tripeptidyl-peptidase-2
MAILDTGVDPAASGLQLTANGLPKIVDIVDATGSGDVILGDTVKATEAADGSLTLTGISGKTLKVSKQWKNPTGEFRLGLKRQVDLYPGGVAKRAAARRKEAFEKKHNILLAEAVNNLKEWELKHPKPSTPEELSEQANLESIVAYLNKEMENYEDDLFYDVVVFHDGQDYRAVLDLCQNGDLTSVKPLADYKLYREYDYFDHADEVTFNAKFYDDGKLLSIVCSAGSHATHVAAIASAYFPNDPVLNGVAPSSQIVSIKIGDTRLGSMETKSALKRSIVAMIDNNVHLANLSYGEDAAFHNKGTWIKSLQDSIEKHNIVFVSSAGNAGPNICTVGAPGGTSSSVISVGAYATASMIKAEYALLNQVNETPFTWSSRGPTLDGEKGVTVYAPGGYFIFFVTNFFFSCNYFCSKV